MKKIPAAFLLLFIIHLSCFSQEEENIFFKKLTEKEIATFNDAITLVRLLYNEEDYNSSFVSNILWASLKKIFRVTIPINEKEINPIIQRREFSFWLCKIFNLNNSDIVLNRYSAYLFCLRLGIINQGRGPFDSFTGAELLDTFTYADYYIRLHKVEPRFGPLAAYLTPYTELPEWRKQLYQELDDQLAAEREGRKTRRRARKDKRHEQTEESLQKLEEIDDTEESNIRYVE